MLPFHRRRERAHDRRINEQWDATTPENEPKGKRLGRFIVDWIKVSWKDILTLAVLGAASQGIYKAPLASTRNFPITFTQSGDIVYPEFAYPNRGWIISATASGLIAVFVPIAVILLAQLRIRSFWDTNNAILGLLYSIVISTLFQVIIKTLIGGFRPYFLSVCQPDISRAATHNTTGLNGVGFQQIMYTVDVCTNPNKKALKTAMTSFPSGHATSAFAAFVFLFLWMNAKLKVWSNHRSHFGWLALLFAPLLGAALLACALTVDQAHNWYDILAGALIGTAASFAAYRALYAAVWDWRYNHIPLMNRTVVDYSAALTPAYMERAVFTRKLGWGRRRRVKSATAAAGTPTNGGRLGKRTSPRAGAGVMAPGSTRSSATYAKNDAVPHAQPSVAYPDATVGRVSGQHDRRVVGEQMV